MRTCKLGEKGCWSDGKCRLKSGCENQVVTNADRIRAMSDEELALFVRAFINRGRCPYDWKGCENCWLKELCNANAYNGELQWLHAPAEGE